MAARDARFLLRKEFSARHLASLSLGLNVPGYPKSNEIVSRFFEYCLDDLKIFLKARQVRLDETEARRQIDEAGDFYIVPFSAYPHSTAGVKQICEDFEENHARGRFIDADITGPDGLPVSSGKAKPCFYCHTFPADECRKENRHDATEVRAFMFSEMRTYCRHRRENTIIRNLSSLALQSVLYEISLTPKPGLVDKFSNGAHDDMNYNTFLNSTAAISGYFQELLQAGFAFTDTRMTNALPVIREIGLRMERSMFGSTGQVNTQKGIIFLMGLSLFTSGYLFARDDRFESEKFRAIIRKICTDLTTTELENNRHRPETHGEKIYRRLKIPGARGEAEMGFPMVFGHGLPELLKFPGLSQPALQRAFLAISANSDDTNILSRSNPDVLNQFRELAQKALDTDDIRPLVDFCLNKNISPGGSADLLAVSIYLFLLIRQGGNYDLLNFPTLIA